MEIRCVQDESDLKRVASSQWEGRKKERREEEDSGKVEPKRPCKL